MGEPTRLARRRGAGGQRHHQRHLAVAPLCRADRDRGGRTGEPLLTEAQIDQARTVRTFGADQVFLSLGFSMEQLIGQGFWISSPFSPFGGDGSFGHAGAGGSYGFADPEHHLAVGYVMNRMSTGLTGDPRARRLIAACYASVGATPTYS